MSTGEGLVVQGGPSAPELDQLKKQNSELKQQLEQLQTKFDDLKAQAQNGPSVQVDNKVGEKHN